MKSLKKVLIGVGAAGVMAASTPASANLSLIFFNEFFVEIYKISANPSISIVNAQINGWNVSLAGGTSDTPAIGLSLNGEAYRQNVASTVASCTNTLFSAGFGCGNSGNNIMRIRMEETTYPVAPGAILVDYSLTTSRTAAQQSGKYGGQVFTQTPNNTTNFPGISITNISPFITTVNVPLNSNNLLLQAGIDLLVPVAEQNGGSQALGKRFQWTNTISSQAVPEPGTLALLGLSLVGLVAIRRKLVA